MKIPLFFMKDVSLYNRLEKRLKHALPGKDAQELMAPSSRNPQSVSYAHSPRLSAVLLLLYPKNGKWYMPLIRRHTYQGQHSDQVSFPGGKKEMLDVDLRETALRETYEEIGVQVNEACVLGNLTPITIPISNYIVHPFIALLDEEPLFSADKYEVKHIIEFPLEVLWQDKALQEKTMNSQGYTITAPIYQLSDDYIWGATAMILSEFKHLLQSVGVINGI